MSFSFFFIVRSLEEWLIYVYIFILNFFKKSFLDLKRGIESRNNERVDYMKSSCGIYINKKFCIY